MKAIYTPELETIGKMKLLQKVNSELQKTRVLYDSYFQTISNKSKKKIQDTDKRTIAGDLQKKNKATQIKVSHTKLELYYQPFYV
jgi:hypothetical protein